MAPVQASAKDPVIRLIHLYRIERGDIWTILAYSLGIGLLSLATPVAVQALVSTIAFGALYQPLVMLSLILLVSVSFGNLLVGIQFYVVEMLQRRLFVRFFGEAAARAQRASAEKHDETSVPELVNRFLDVAILQKTGAVLLLEGSGYLLQTLMGMVLLAFYHPLLLAFDAMVAAVLALILFGLGRGGIATAISQSKAKYAALGWLEDIAGHSVLFKSAGGPAFCRQQTDRLAAEYLEASQAHFRIVMGQKIGALALHALAGTTLLGLGGWMVIDRQLTLGQLIAAELVVSAMIAGFPRLGKTLENFYELMASMDKLGHLVDLPPEPSGDLQPRDSTVPMAVSLRTVSFRYPEGPAVLEGIDLEIHPGDRLALVGPVAGGKGSLLDLLFGLRAPGSGSILLDGRDIRNLDREALRNQIALVQRAEWVPGSLWDNLSLNRPEIDPERAFEALRDMELLDSVLALPEGIDTRLNHHGSPLLPEQLVRLSLARAIAGWPRLLLIHRQLDHLDRSILPVVIERLIAPQMPWTLVVSTADPQVLARCNRRIELKAGRLREERDGLAGAGRHE